MNTIERLLSLEGFGLHMSGSRAMKIGHELMASHGRRVINYVIHWERKNATII